MKDFLDRELSIDDSVIMIKPGYRDFTLARVTGFTAQYVKVVLKSPGTNSVRKMNQKPEQLVIVDGPELTKFLLKHSG